jgi:hypothetical protein
MSPFNQKGGQFGDHGQGLRELNPNAGRKRVASDEDWVQFNREYYKPQRRGVDWQRREERDNFNMRDAWQPDRQERSQSD